ncbi:MAG: signal peptidase I [Fimbriimonadaceae bacterium]|nr:signal peptidase I [Fimbriimonadaceae bacterium]
MDWGTNLGLGDLIAQSASTRDTIDAIARTPLSQIVAVAVVLTALRAALAPVMERTPAHRRTGLFAVARFFNEGIDAIVYALVFVFLLIRPYVLQAFVIPSGSMWPALYVNDLIVLNKAIYRFTKPKAGDIVVFRPNRHALSPRDMHPDGEAKIDYIKRCIGVPGDLIEIRNGELYRNGTKVDEWYRNYSTCNDPNPAACENFSAMSKEEVARRTPANFKLVEKNGQINPVNWTEFDVNSQLAMSRNVSEGLPYNIAPDFAVVTPEEGERLKRMPAVKIPAGHYLFMGDNRNYSFDGRAWGIVPEKNIVGKAEAIWWPPRRWQLTR